MNLKRGLVLKKTIDTYAKNIQNQVIEKQKILEDDWAIIKKMREDTENRQQLVEKEKSFMEATTALQQFVQSAKDEMEQSYLNARNTLQVTVFTIVQEIAERNNFDVVLTETAFSFNSPYIYAKPSISINQQVIKTLNARLPKVDLKLNWESVNWNSDVK